MKIGELFSGYGGLGMGVQAAIGGDVVWHSEYDKAASKILDHHWPDIPNHGDITLIDWSTVEPVDVLTGGSPCQDLSHAGKRGGMSEGTRSNLWVSMREAIAELRPQMVVWENVRGAYSAAADSDVEPCAGCVGDGPGVHLRALHRVLGDFADLGYDAEWCGLRAADVGAPHGRFRVFVVATNTLGSGRDGWTRDTGRRQVVGTATAGSGRIAAPDTDSVGQQRGGGTRGRRPGPMDRDLATPDADVTGLEGRRLRRSGRDERPVRQDGVVDWGTYADAINRWANIIGRPAPAPTQLGRTGNAQLSPAFVEWMMGLPAGHVTDVDIIRNHQIKALGNGVVPQQAEAAIRHLLQTKEAAA